MIDTILNNIFFNFILLIISFIILTKSADIFVESSVGIAAYFNLPKMLVGIVIVAFATTAPEIAVSAQSAYLGHPEIAFGNALGSVMADDGLALALAAVFAPVAISINKNLLNISGIFLIFIDVLAFLLALNGHISRFEGIILVFIMIVYLITLYIIEKKRRLNLVEIDEKLLEKEKKEHNILKISLLFILGLAGVLISSRLIIHSSIVIANFFKISETIIGLTVIAIGTSLPEIFTAIIAARKGHGEIAVGDIIGADILNILWIIGVSAAITPIELSKQTVIFAFISMFIIVFTMLAFMRYKYNLNKFNGIVLVILYLIYLIIVMFFLPEMAALIG